MSDDLKRGIAGAAAVAASHPAPYATRAPADADRRLAASATAALGSPTPAASSVASSTAPKIQLKSADMKEEMQKEAFDISRVVIPLFPCTLDSRFGPVALSLVGFGEGDLFIWFVLLGIREAHHGEGHRRVHQEGV